MKRLTIVIVLLVAVTKSLHANDNSIPRPLSSHPGNIFLTGEDVVVPLSAKDGATWQLFDYDGKPSAAPAVQGGKVRLGRLPVGYYELRQGEAATTIAVLSPLQAPVSPSSPIAIDVAMSWFYHASPEKAAAASLCRLAGISWVRDRMTWGEIEPRREQFAQATRYDQSAQLQSEAGLHVLQVQHSTPAWAGQSHKHFPEDLRDIHRFFRSAAARWKGQVQAFEPWNEADIDMFGGHTGAEMAALQKAAYLGIKAGNPDAIACLNVFAIARPETLDDLAANVAWPYFDTCNLHHYVRPEEYPGWYAAFRRISAGRPLWVTEFSQPVHWSGDAKAQEPTAADQRLQACRVPIVFASALNEGPAEAFYFMLPHYTEGKTQFGIVHRDLTPRPAYVALAAVGRLLADARPFGRWKLAGTQTRVFLFRARPDGRDAEVLVAWTTEPQAEVQLPVAPLSLLDHLGRILPTTGTALRLSPAPVYAVFPPGTGQKLPLSTPPVLPPRQEAKPSPIVLQAVWPRDHAAVDKSAYKIPVDEDTAIPVFVYNFSDSTASGSLTLTAPAGWEVKIPNRVELSAGERKQLTMKIHRPVPKGASAEKIQVSGDFVSAGTAVLSLRVQPEPRH